MLDNMMSIIPQITGPFFPLVQGLCASTSLISYTMALSTAMVFPFRLKRSSCCFLGFILSEILSLWFYEYTMNTGEDISEWPILVEKPLLIKLNLALYAFAKHHSLQFLEQTTNSRGCTCCLWVRR